MPLNCLGPPPDGKICLPLPECSWGCEVSLGGRWIECQVQKGLWGRQIWGLRQHWVARLQCQWGRGGGLPALCGTAE